ncbi:hypothetical protein OYC64_003967 [Pagothenia borchgrevinki]|uniref:Uncharacterized protein n=1 Tax=Pagothenia borchgrevinki TaxID=8213 RepID=A0ABD2FR42_PAGBO
MVQDKPSMTPRGERGPSGASDLMPILKKLPSSVQIETSCCFCSTGNPLLLFIIGAVVAALALLIAGIGFLVYRKRNDNKNHPSPASSSELTEKLNQPSE